MDSACGYPIAGVGCPIRRSPDQSLLAAPRGFSQRATSFIASRRQGIHQMPLLSSLAPPPAPAAREAGTARQHTRCPGTARLPQGPAARADGDRRTHAMPSAPRKQGAYRLPAHARARRPGEAVPAHGHRHHTMSKNRTRQPPTRRRAGPPARRGGRPRTTRLDRRPAPGGCELVGPGRLERPTSRLSGVRSNQLSYRPASHPDATPTAPGRRRRVVPAEGTGAKDVRRRAGCMRRPASRRGPARKDLRKEVIQPQVPLRLPCYDFTPVADPTVDGCLRASAVSPPASGRANSHGVTGGVYKARERIHRGVLIRDY